MIAPEPYFSAYLKVIEYAVSQSRYLSYNSTNSFFERIINKKNKQIGDLLDTVTVIVELLDEWERCDEAGLRKRIEWYDEVWSNKGEPYLMNIFNAEFKRKTEELKLKKE